MTEHCWHRDGVTYDTYPPFHYETCCWCGKTRRVGQRFASKGHGPYAGEVLVPDVEDVGPCSEEDRR